MDRFRDLRRGNRISGDGTKAVENLGLEKNFAKLSLPEFSVTNDSPSKQVNADNFIFDNLNMINSVFGPYTYFHFLMVSNKLI